MMVGVTLAPSFLDFCGHRSTSNVEYLCLNLIVRATCGLLKRACNECSVMAQLRLLQDSVSGDCIEIQVPT